MKSENVVYVGLKSDNVEYVVYVCMKSKLRKCYMLMKSEFICMKSKLMLYMLLKM